MTAHSQTFPEMDARSTPQGNRKVYQTVVSCCRCKETLAINANTAGAPAPEFVKRKAQQAGWSPKGRKWLCPMHVNKAKPAKPTEAENVTPILAASGEVFPGLPPANGVSPSEYWTDERIAAAYQVNRATSAGANAIEEKLGLSVGALHRLWITHCARNGFPLPVRRDTIARVLKAMDAMQRGQNITTAAKACKLSTDTARRFVECVEKGYLTMEQLREKAGVAVAARVTPIRQLTPKETRRVNDLIERHFNEDDGQYVDGWDDEKVAEEANVPRVNVAAYRDEAFGPLKSDPALEDALEKVAAAESKIHELRKQHATVCANFERELAGVQASIDAAMRLIEHRSGR